jgi:glycerate kinase
VHVLVAPDRMGVLTATEVGNAIRTGWLTFDSTSRVDVVPLDTATPDDRPESPGASPASRLQDAVDAAGLVDRATGVDLVVTAEAVFDGGSLVDRVPRGAAWAAQRAGVPCVVLAGRVLVGRREFAAAGVDAAYELGPDPGPAGPASGDLADRLAAAAERVARTWTGGGR